VAIFEGRDVRLGKGSVRTDVRTLLLARYVDRAELPPAPDALDVTAGVPEWPMYANDTRGDCTCAAAGHMIEAWTAAAHKHVAEISTASVLRAFEAVKVVEDGEEGAVELDVLNYWRNHGIGRHHIKAYARVSVYDHDLIRSATSVFEGLYIGLQLPFSARSQSVWDWKGNLHGPNRPGSWGGHAVDVVAYDAETLTVVTWGELQRMTWAFWDRYCDEAYAIISNDFLAHGKAPSGLMLDALLADLELVTA
jgi:hypothetical protein